MVHLSIDQIVEMYHGGMSARQISAALGTSDQTIVRRLRAAGEEIRIIRYKGPRPHRRIEVNVERIRELRVLGMSTRAIGVSLGVSEECIRDRMIESGIERLPTSFPGKTNPAWKGGRTIDDDGYVMIFSPNHPNANSGGYVREHRLVMESKLSRLLLPKEVVHHIDGRRSNNHPDNLELFATNADHLRNTLKGRAPRWTEDGLRRIRARHP